MSDVDSDWAEALEQQRAANMKSLTELRAQGADLDHRAVLQKRLETFIEWMLPEGSTERAFFELEYEGVMSNVLEQAHSEVIKARLAPDRKTLSKLFLPPAGST
jgi:hypothetical protein